MSETFKSILLVDDDMTLREMYAERLKAEGFQVNMAKDGEEALQMATENHPNVILLDIMLPGLDGFEVLRQIKESPEEKDIPVYLSTNLGGGPQDKEKGMKLGAADYLIKSDHTPAEIVEIIKGALWWQKF